MAYKYGNREQLTLLPDCIDHYVSEEDPVRAYDAFIDALDVEALGLVLDDTQVGNSRYEPVTMLKLLAYGYSYGWRSSRKLERALYHNLSFIWLAGGLKPDHKTIANFRKDHKEVLSRVLKGCVRMCMSLDLIEGNVLFVDGTKLRATAGKRQSKGKDGLQNQLASIEERIEELLARCEQTDEQESGSLVKMKRELRSKKQLREKIESLVKELKEEEQVNVTDPDSRIMKTRQGTHACYNSQLTVDDARGLIVSVQAISEGTDHHQLAQQIAHAEQAMGHPSQVACADAGYSSVDDLKPLVDQGDRTVIVPNERQAQKRPKPLSRFDKTHFTYHSETDTYTCPQGKELYFSYQAEGSNKRTYRMRNYKECLECAHYGECTRAKRGRTLYRLVNEETYQKLKITYQSEEAQQVYRRRKMRVEHPFGHIKRNLGVSAFLLRGLEGVNAELSLLASCFNIRRVITLLGGVQPMIKALKQVT